jgi:hypothetical protein
MSDDRGLAALAERLHDAEPHARPHTWADCREEQPWLVQAAAILGDTGRFSPDGGLDAAWAEAEAVLPEGWAIRIMTCRCHGDGKWKVSAGPDLSGDPVAYIEETPAAALRALAAKLRETTP